jgi:hypothetical protein
LRFNLLDLPVTENWLRQVELFIAAGQPWDDPNRFYNFPSYGPTAKMIMFDLQRIVNLIAPHLPESVEPMPDEINQDYLNYLHNIFERYHGLYDQQNTLFWLQAPETAQRALSELNIAIHRFETLGGIPRFVGTWRGKPNRYKFADEDFALFRLEENWGDLRLNYCEIGKTIQDLANDGDRYISEDAFQPMHHYCFDFTVRFNTKPDDYFQQQQDLIWRYYDQHSNFFQKRGFQRHDPKLALGSITIGHLIYNDAAAVIDAIDRNQRLVNIAVLN